MRHGRGAALLQRQARLRAVQSLDLRDCLQLVDDIHTVGDPAEILAQCEALARRHYPDLLN